MTNTNVNREAWLHNAIKELTPLFTDAGNAAPPKVQVSVGFPGGGSARSRIGECWSVEATGDKVPHIFISPILTEPVIVLATLAHELVHAMGHHGHGSGFRKVATSIGLEGKMTATVPGDELIGTLKGVAEKLGEYPHKGITLGGRKKQTTRMLKVVCFWDDAYKIRMTRSQIDTKGTPLCPCHNEPMVES